MGTQMSSRGAIAMLVALTALALVVRLKGIGFMLPHFPEPDTYFVEQVEIFDTDSDQAFVKPAAYTKYPHLLGRALWLIQRVGGAAEPAPEATLGAHLAAAARPYLSGRILVACLSVLLVPGTWFLARRLTGAGWSLFAAALVATSLLHFNFSQQARPHGPLATFVVFALLGALHMRAAPTVSNLLLGGCLAGLAVACLHNGVFALPPLVLAFLLRRRGAGVARHWQLAVPLSVAALLAAIFYPFLWSDAHVPAGTVARDASSRFPHDVSAALFDGSGLAQMWRAALAYDPTLLVLGLIGLVAVLWPGTVTKRAPQWKPDLAVALAFALPYSAVLCLFANTFERFLIPLLPFVACLGAVGLEAITRRLVAGARSRALLGTAFALACLAFPANMCLRLVSLRAERDTASLAADWLAQHLDPVEDVLLVHPVPALPLFHSPRVLDRDESKPLWLKHPWIRYQLRRADIFARQVPHRIFVVGGLRLPSEAVASKQRSEIAERRYLNKLPWDLALLRVFPDRRRSSLVTRQVHDIGERLVRFSPLRHPDAIQPGPGYQGDDMIARILGSERWGPCLEIYAREE